MTHPLYGSRTWYLSGDLARQDAGSTFHFLGRTDNEIKISGHRIMLEEVELYLRENTGFSTVAVVHMQDDLGVAETLIGFVVEDKIDEPEIKEAMLKDLPRPLVPRRIFAVNEMPLSTNGKVDRQELLRIAHMKAVI
jgi:surfactin family lipopeptide synthetase C